MRKIAKMSFLFAITMYTFLSAIKNSNQDMSILHKSKGNSSKKHDTRMTMQSQTNAMLTLFKMESIPTTSAPTQPPSQPSPMSNHPSHIPRSAPGDLRAPPRSTIAIQSNGPSWPMTDTMAAQHYFLNRLVSRAEAAVQHRPMRDEERQVRPQFRSKIVCMINCKHCSKPVCKRGMKAILLADMNVILSTTKLIL